MRVSKLLDKLRKIPELNVTEERSLSVKDDIPQDTRRVINIYTNLPFPKFEPAWYTLVVRSEDQDIPQDKIDAMLRHLWMAQLDIKDDD